MSPELHFDATQPHPVRSVWLKDIETATHELRIDGSVVGAYGTKDNGRLFVDCGEPNSFASERLSIHMREPNASEAAKRHALTALALSMWQVTY